MFIRKGAEEGAMGLIANLIIFPSIGYAIGYIYRLISSSLVESPANPVATSPMLNSNPTPPIKHSDMTQIRMDADTRSVDSDSIHDSGSPSEEDHWATAMNELETGQRRPGVWGKAFAEADGDETKAKVAYLKVRVKQLSDAAAELVAKAEAARLDAIAVPKMPRAELRSAVLEGEFSAAKNLLESGVSPHRLDEDGRSLLDHAKEKNDKRMIELLECPGAATTEMVLKKSEDTIIDGAANRTIQTETESDNIDFIWILIVMAIIVVVGSFPLMAYMK